MTNVSKIEERLLESRQSGAKGTQIRMHRALRSMDLGFLTWATMIALPIFFSFVLWMSLEPITSLWATVFDFWLWKLKIDAHVSYLGMEFFGQLLYIPFPDLPTSTPSMTAVWINLVIAIVMMAVTIFLPKSQLPMVYIFRAALFIQMSASVFFFVQPEGLPYDLAHYIGGMLTVGLYIMFLATPLLALIYYVFDFSFMRKFISTILILGYFTLVLPFQYMVHALIISYCSMLFMPTLYLLFGALLNMLMFVGWYSWAMTWRPRNGEEVQALALQKN